ncbi:MAG: class I SAM-dependent methyltransferase [Bryobacterales bacterium]
MIEYLRKVLSPKAARPVATVSQGLPPATPRNDGPVIARRSHGLGYFCQTLNNDPTLEVLDLGGLSESNVRFLSERGCRIHAVNLLAKFDEYKMKLPGRRFTAGLARDFVAEYLDFEAEQFSAILVWDLLEHLDSEVLYITVPRLAQILRPGGGMLTFFHSLPRGEMVELYRYDIENAETLRLQARQTRPLPHTFNNRSLERLFESFHLVKFFLTRDNLREVIAVR